MNLKDRFIQLAPVTKNLLIINTIIYLACALIPKIGYYAEVYGGLYYFTSSQFLPWQLVSYMFLHANFMHLFFNMFALWMFGEIIERSLGSARFLFYYISCGIGAALIQEGIFALMINHYAGELEYGDQLCALLRSSSPITFGDLANLHISANSPVLYSLDSLYHSSTVGASGAIYGVLLAFGFLFPHMQIYLLFPPMPLKARTAVIVFAVIELVLGIGNSISSADNVAHFAHLGGMVVGFLILYWWKKSGTIRTYF